MATGLTKKEKGFVKDYVETENGTQSVLNNYDTEDANSAGVIASQNLKKVRIQEAIQELKSTIAEALPDELLIAKHLEGLEAGKTIYRNNVSTKEVEEVGYEPDYLVRHKYLDSAYKIKGSYAAEKSVNLNLTANVADPKALEIARKYEEEIKKGL